LPVNLVRELDPFMAWIDELDPFRPKEIELGIFDGGASSVSWRSFPKKICKVFEVELPKSSKSNYHI